MSPDDLPLIATTIIATLISGLLVNIVWQNWQKRPRVQWYSIAEIIIPDDFGFFHSLNKLVERSFEEKDLLSAEAKAIIKGYRYYERMLFKIAIDNSGRAAARKVTVFFSDEPAGFDISPRTGIRKEKTADGMYAYEIDTVPSKSTLTVTFYEITKSSIQGVFFDGESLPETYFSKLGPYYPEKRFGFLSLLYACLAGMWLIILSDQFLGMSSSSKQNAKSSELSGDIEKLEESQ